MYTITQYKKDIPKIREGARRDPGMSNNEVMKLEEDKDLKGEFKELCKALRNNHRINPNLYVEYDVKRGLRDSAGKGVLTGLTEVSDVTGYNLINGRNIPAEGRLYYQGIMHDMSKYSPTEFLVGVKYYQGTASPNNAERMEKGISMSWLHHKGRNKHHFEYWIDYSIDKDHPGLVGMKIPKKYMAEMFVDRVSAGKIYNGDEFDQKSPLEYFEHGIGASIMCEASRDYLLNLLRMYAEKGEKYTFAYLKNDLKNDMSGYDKISPFQQCKKNIKIG